MFKDYHKFDEDFLMASNYFNEKRDYLIEKIEALPEKQKLCMKCLYAFMPLGDALTYDFDLFLSYAKHGLFVYENSPWKEKITEDLFFKDILCARINSEKIENCRPVLYEMFKDRIRGMSLEQAIIELNYACFEHVTYKSTDIRTISPLNILKRAYGRCGEESTFTASVLRACGIPTKQVYAPFWSHLDDNHAWVEAFDGESWRYLGACEPEPVLDIGWFTTASRRAMLIHSREFYKGDNSFTTDGIAKIVNHLGSYAKTKLITIKVTENGEPMADCRVFFNVLNYSAMMPLTVMKTDKTGICQLETGYATLYINAVKGGKSIEYSLGIDEFEHEVKFENAVFHSEEGISNFNSIAPVDPNLFQQVYPNDIYKAHREKYIQSDKRRLEKEAAFEIKHSARLDIYLEKARGNAGEIIKYYEENKNNKYVLTLLEKLNEKDIVDGTAHMLGGFLNYFTKFSQNYDDEVFTRYLLCPRVMNEELDYYCNYLFENIEFENPVKLWEYINNSIKFEENREYSQIHTAAKTTFKYKRGSEESKKILFVAACRSFGIPARMNFTKQLVEFYENGEFRTVENKKAKLILKHDNLSYGSNFSISMLSNGIYSPVINLENTKEISLESGYYRIITANRLPNGNIFARKYDFFLREDEVREMEISLREYEIKDMLFKLKMHDFMVSHGGEICGASYSFKDSITIWLLTSHEPSEHIINELRENAELLRSIKINIVIKNSSELENASIKALIGEINPEIYIDEDFLNHEMTARKLYLDPAMLPLAAAVDKNSFARYACCGYNVGSVELLAKVYNFI